MHFTDGGWQNKLYDIGLENDLTSIHIYTRCTRGDLAEGCLYEINGDVWAALAETNRGGAVVKLTVRGGDDQGASYGASTARSLSFSKDDVRGALF